jgi:plasmid stabilization system protein ParE
VVVVFKPAQSNGFGGALSRKKQRRLQGMPQSAWSDKRERQYEHIKEALLERGTGEDRAEEIAARTVNKERAQHGEAREASRTSIEDLSPGRRGGLRSHRGSQGRTYDQLRNEAKARGIKGRSRMNKAQLEKVLSR